MAGLYIHIPFCAKRCIYCDFFSNTHMGYKEVYINALIKEMVLRKEYLPDRTIETIYLGGGTPSQLAPAGLGQIIEGVYNNFQVTAGAEITVEVNPDDINDSYVKGLKKLPVNRVSMGIQSFQDRELLFLNRRHKAAQAIDAIKLLQDNGFYNISIDLIYGLPDQTSEEWDANIRQGLALQVPHISAYHLMYEEGTALYQLKEAGKIQETDEENSLQAFMHLIDTLKSAGFMHYEISNFALPGFISQHNSSYWRNIPYLGIGASAHSYNGQQRDWNVSSIPAYIDGIKKGIPATEGEHLDRFTCYNDAVITGLRTMWGLNLPEVEKKYGADLALYCKKQAEKFIKNGLLNHENDRLTLSAKGIFTSDNIMSELLFIK